MCSLSGGQVCSCVCWVGGGGDMVIIIIGKKKDTIRSKKQKCALLSEKLVWDLISSKKDQSSCGTD